jgi:hypothetical protein
MVDSLAKASSSSIVITAGAIAARHRAACALVRDEERQIDELAQRALSFGCVSRESLARGWLNLCKDNESKIVT